MASQLTQWRSVERRRAGYRRTYRKVFLKALDAQIKPFLDSIRFLNPNNTIIGDVVINNREVAKAYESLYRNVGGAFMQHERDQFLKSAPKNMQRKDEFTDSLFFQDLMEYIRTGLPGANIVSIGDTSVEHLQRLLDDLIPEIQALGLGASEAQTMLRDRLISQWHRDMRFRTERIVRTEVSAASNWGSFKGIQSTGLPFDKFWVHAFDERTRDSHIGVKSVDINAPFDVGGYPMMYPLDSSMGAPAGEIINCRCTTTYSLRQTI